MCLNKNKREIVAVHSLLNPVQVIIKWVSSAMDICAQVNFNFLFKNSVLYSQYLNITYIILKGGGVYTNVQSYESWIASTIANN